MNKRQYKKAKRKFFRKKISRYYLLHNNKIILMYSCGIFVNTEKLKPVVNTIMKMPDTEAFWFCHLLSIKVPGYKLVYEKHNNSTTVTFSGKAEFPL